jgi:phosphatidate cytidylyltransferase
VNPAQQMAAILLVVAGIGVAAAVLYAILPMVRGRPLTGRTALARAVSYAALAVALALAVVSGTIGVTILLGVIAALALLEWARLGGLPTRHVIAIEVANAIVFAAIATRGTAAADILVGGLAFAAALLPVARPDTSRAFRDFGTAAAGLVVITVMLVHGVALTVERGPAGAALVAAVAVGCAGSDVAAFFFGKRFGRTPLAPRLSPNKTRAGLVGNFVGAAIALLVAAPVLVPLVGWAGLAGLALIVAVGAVWGDLLESAAKREFGVKDAGTWLPGFGGILDRVDSLLLALPLVYWAARLLDPVAVP